MRDPAQTGKKPVQLFVGEGERVAAREQDVPHFGMSVDVGDRLLPLRLEEDAVVVGVFHHARPRAVAAVGRAGVRHQEQHPVRVAVHDPGHRAVPVLSEGILRLSGHAEILVGDRNHRPSERVLGVVRIQEAEVVRRDGKGQGARMPLDCSPLIVGQPHNLFQRLEGAHAVAKLPSPVAPLRGGDQREVPRAKLFGSW